jgi:DNA-binding transcriptional ArsR family regulator
MDLSDPTRSVTPTLDGPVLAVLAQTGRPLTAGEVASLAARGSEIGVRRTLARLVDQGIVHAHQMGRNRVHELNREHLAAPVADLLAGLRLELWKRLREQVSSFSPKPFYACVFGSSARGDGDFESDIDLLLVHPRFPGEQMAKYEMWSAVVIGLMSILTPPKTALLQPTTSGAAALLSPRHMRAWEQQVDRLHNEVFSWTGNRLQVIDLSTYEWTTGEGISSELLDEIKRDAVVISKASPLELTAATRSD